VNDIEAQDVCRIFGWVSTALAHWGVVIEHGLQYAGIRYCSRWPFI